MLHWNACTSEYEASSFSKSEVSSVISNQVSNSEVIHYFSIEKKEIAFSGEQSYQTILKTYVNITCLKNEIAKTSCGGTLAEFCLWWTPNKRNI